MYYKLGICLMYHIEIYIHLFMSEITCSTVPSNEVYRTIVK